MVRSVNVKKTKKFKENHPENYHVHDSEEGDVLLGQLDWEESSDEESPPSYRS